MEAIRETLRMHPLHPNVAMAHVKFLQGDGTASPYCPRSLLEKALGELKELGYTV
jgi:glutamine synthetase